MATSFVRRMLLLCLRGRSGYCARSNCVARRRSAVIWNNVTNAATNETHITPAPIAIAPSVSPWPERSGWKNARPNFCHVSIFMSCLRCPRPWPLWPYRTNARCTGISLDGSRWVGCRPRFLLPVRVLSSRFRRLYLRYLEQAYTAGKLRFHGQLQHLSDPASFARYLAPLRKSKWVVYAKPPFGGPEKVLDYLGRYTHRVAISNHRLQQLQDGRVTFAYKDYKDGHQQKLMTLSADEFLRRFLLHVLPEGFQRIRHYGLFTNRHRAENLARCRELLGVSAPVAPPPRDYRERYRQLTGQDLLQCPQCQKGQMRRTSVLPAGAATSGWDSS